jgi:DNA-binding transcriptional ArsR family regulator
MAEGNYHLRALERHALVELVEERRKGNVTERMMRATAAS